VPRPLPNPEVELNSTKAERESFVYGDYSILAPCTGDWPQLCRVQKEFVLQQSKVFESTLLVSNPLCADILAINLMATTAEAGTGSILKCVHRQSGDGITEPVIVGYIHFECGVDHLDVYCVQVSLPHSSRCLEALLLAAMVQFASRRGYATSPVKLGLGVTARSARLYEGLGFRRICLPAVPAAGRNKKIKQSCLRFSHDSDELLRRCYLLIEMR